MNIEQMAREAGLTDFCGCTEANIERFAALVRASALEEAAQACESSDKSTHPADVADAIRALAAKDKP